MGKTVHITARIPDDLLEMADGLAKKAGISRNKLITNVLDVALREVAMADKVGLFTVAVLLRDLREQLKAWTTMVREDPAQVREMAEQLLEEEGEKHGVSEMGKV